MQTILITGGARGIGRAAALLCARFSMSLADASSRPQPGLSGRRFGLGADFDNPKSSGNGGMT